MRTTNLRRPIGRVRRSSFAVAALLLLLNVTGPLAAQQSPRTIQLTLDRMVELAVNNSYRIRQLNMDIQRTRHRLRAYQARLKSRVDLELAAPEFESVSEPQWNSDLRRNEIVHENTRRWEMELSVRQPVILFGFPTNGYLSLNNRVYRYRQVGEDHVEDIQYYNRYYIAYEQPLFQPNELKNDLEEAELNLERTELEFRDDAVEMLEDVARDYFGLFAPAYRSVIYSRLVDNLEVASAAAAQLADADSTRTIETDQIRVELANAREQLEQARSSFRLQVANVKQRLRLAEADSIRLEPVLDVRPVQVEESAAIAQATRSAPRLRQLDISQRMDEIQLENTKGRNSFRVDLQFSYGREMLDERFDNIWNDPTNSYTVGVNARLPLWDWGERRERIAAQRIALDQTRLRIEEVRSRIVSDVRNEIRNLEEYEARALAMEENLELARQISRTSLERYADGTITALDLLQSFQRQAETARNFLDAYLGWRGSLLRLQRLTFYDFEQGMPVLDRFGIRVPVQADAD